MTATSLPPLDYGDAGTWGRIQLRGMLEDAVARGDEFGSDAVENTRLLRRRHHHAGASVYIKACFPDMMGKLFFGIGEGQHWTDGGKYVHENFRHEVVDYPNDAIGQKIDQLLTLAETADVYVCPNLMYKTRTLGSCVGAKMLAADWDGDDQSDHEDLCDTVEQLGGFAVASGSPWHVHAYLPLSQPVHSARATQLAKGFQAMLPPGSDKGKHSVNDLLRLPGTLNHKPVRDTGKAARVGFLIWPSE